MTISIRTVFLFLCLTGAFLLAAGWGVQFYASIHQPDEFQNKACHGFIRMFYLDGEANVPTWFQSTMLLFSSVLLATISSNATDTRTRRQWGILSLIFLVLSLDEAACIHEAIGSFLSRQLHTTGIFTYAWVIPGGIFALVVFLFFLRFLRGLPARTRRAIIIAGAVYVTGTLGWEMVGGWYDSIHGSRNLTYMTLTVCEEAFECAGIILFIHTLLLYSKELAVTRQRVASTSSSPANICIANILIQD